MLNLLTPWFLVGLGALAAPILVHLIQKQRKEILLFPSLMFITQIPYQSARRQQIRHWLLLLLRCLAVLLLIFAFARPFFPSRHATGGSFSTGGRDIVIAMDRSYSMGYGDRWRRAVAAAHDVISHMHATDRASVVYFAGTAWAASDLTSDKAALRAAIDSVRPTAGATRYDAVFRLVQHILGDTARPRREVVLISDAQRVGWSARELTPLPQGTQFTQVNLSDSTTADMAVTHVDVQYDTTVGRERVTVEATLANHGAVAIQHRPVTFELNKRRMQTRVVDCPANSIVRVPFDTVPIPPGTSRGVITTGADSLEINNHFYFMIARTPSIPVLLVQSPETTSTATALPGKFLTLALGISQNLSFRVRTVLPGQFTADALQKTALVVLNNAPMPGGELGQQLVQYVRNGGGLLVVLGSRNSPDTWPALSSQLFPRPVAPVVDRIDDRGATLEFLDRKHPVFEAFNVSHSGDFSVARFFRYWTLVPGPNDQQLARFDDGRVALLERHVGAGRVLVWNSDLDGAWSDFPLQPVFLPLVHNMVKYAAGYEEEHSWMTVGDVQSLPTLFGGSPTHADAGTRSSATNGAQYVVISPTGTQIRMTGSSSPTSLDLTEQGFYDITRTGGDARDSTRTLAVNVDLAESDLAPLDTGLLATAVLPRSGTQDHQDVLERTPGDVEHQQGLWWYLLAATILLLGLETFLSNRLSRATR